MFEICFSVAAIYCLYYFLFLLCSNSTIGRIWVFIFGTIFSLVIVAILLHKSVENSAILTIFWSTITATSTTLFYNWPKVYEYFNRYLLKKLLTGADFSAVNEEALKLAEIVKSKLF